MPVAPLNGIHQRAVFIPAAPGAYFAVGVTEPLLAHPAITMPPGAGAVEFVFEQNTFEAGGTVGANLTPQLKFPVGGEQGNPLQIARFSIPFFPVNAPLPDECPVTERAVGQVLEMGGVGFQVGGALNV